MRIVIATDGSPEANLAVERVAARPWPKDSSVRVLSVALPAQVGSGLAGFDSAMLERIEAEAEGEAKAIAAAAAQTLRKAGLNVDTKVRRGDPRGEITDEATDWSSDLIVVGSRGRTGLKRWVLGSVAEGVVRQAPCSVEVVREKAPAR